MRGAATAIAAALVLAGCTSVATEPPDSTSTRPKIAAEPQEDPTGFALALGVDAQDPRVQRQLSGFALVVVDGTETTHRSVAKIQRNGSTLLGYLSVGTVEPGRSWFATAKREGWLLERWDRWDEWYADVSQPGLRSLLLTQARSILAAGFDGIFLDNTDMVEGHPAQRAGMVRLVADLAHLVGPKRALFAQNGDPIAAGIIDDLDGWNREDVSFTYDAARHRYVATSAADRRQAVRQLQRIARRDVYTSTTDYLDPAAPTARRDTEEAVRRSCAAGAQPYVADIDLTHVPDPPLDCP